MDSKRRFLPPHAPDDALVALRRTPAFDLEELSRDRSDLQELQTATSEVLEAVGRYGFELEPMFETVVRHAIHLCRADAGQIFTHERDHCRLAWAARGSRAYRSLLAARDIPLGRGTLVGRGAT